MAERETEHVAGDANHQWSEFRIVYNHGNRGAVAERAAGRIFSDVNHRWLEFRLIHSHGDHRGRRGYEDGSMVVGEASDRERDTISTLRSSMFVANGRDRGQPWRGDRRGRLRLWFNRSKRKRQTDYRSLHQKRREQNRDAAACDVGKYRGPQ